MTDAQLRLLLLSMLDELERTLDDVRELMPEVAEHETTMDWQLKPEVATGVSMADVLLALKDENRQSYQVHGDFVALEPLTALLEKWRERVDELSRKDD